MKRFIIFCVLLILCKCSNSSEPKIFPPVRQFIILKADDFEVNPRWIRFISYIENKNIKASVGIIGITLEDKNAEYYSLIKAIYNRGNIEFWNHGYSHQLNAMNDKGEKCSEFQNTPYEFQKRHLMRTQTLAKRKLDIVLHTFGAPGNAIDIHTVAAISEVDDLKVWLCGDTSSNRFVLERSCDIEYPTHNPDYQQFLKNYYPEKNYLVLQIHPDSWDDARFNQFEQIVEFLIQKGVTFITPFEYYQRMVK